MKWLRAIGYSLATVLVSHAIAFGLMRILPDAAVIALGLDSNNQEAVAAFRQAHKQRSYPETVLAAAGADLGLTLDGVPVRDELRSALVASVPRYLVAFALVMLSAFALPIGLRDTRSLQGGLGSFLSFLPPYVPPFVALGLVSVLTFSFATPVGPAGTEILLALTLAMPAASLAVTQASLVMARLLQTDHARTVLSLGATDLQVRFMLAANLAYEMMPSLQKLAVALFGVLLFVEPIFGLQGVGTVAMRAVRRSDTDLLLGVVLVLALATAMIGMVGQVAQDRLRRIG